MRQNIETLGQGTPVTSETEMIDVQIDDMPGVQDTETIAHEELPTPTAEADPASIADLVEQARAAAVAATGEVTPEAIIDELTNELGLIDDELIAAVRRRAELSQRLADARGAQGTPRRVLIEEVQTMERFGGELGDLGHQIGLAVINVGRQSLRQPSPNPEN